MTLIFFETHHKNDEFLFNWVQSDSSFIQRIFILIWLTKFKRSFFAHSLRIRLFYFLNLISLTPGLMKSRFLAKLIFLKNNLDFCYDWSFVLYSMNYAICIILIHGTDTLYVLNHGRPRIVIPKKMISILVHNAHDLMGHQGISRMRSCLAYYYWPGKDNDITEYVDTCMICAQRKSNDE